MANPVQALNENFVYNSLIARSLVPLMPASDRPQLRLWIQKLHEVDGDTDILKIRNEYMWFLLLVLQSNRVTQPFTTDPPKGELQVLKNILVNENKNRTMKRLLSGFVLLVFELKFYLFFGHLLGTERLRGRFNVNGTKYVLVK